MAFTDYKTVDAVLKKHKLRLVAGTVVAPVADAPPFTDYFRDELRLSLHYLTPGRSSEIGCGEILLFPILREVWKSYREELSLFTHEELEFDDDLKGVPDYFVCKVTEYGRIPDVPYLLVVEAKLDDFDKAWGQCVAAMLAAQKLNGAPDVPVYGIATNGKAWEFGVLKHNEFTQQQEPIAVANLDTLREALHAVFRACRAMATAPPAPTA
jgi:predicted ester cyclase